MAHLHWQGALLPRLLVALAMDVEDGGAVTTPQYQALLTRCLRYEEHMHALEERVHALENQLRRAGVTPRRLVTAAEAALMCDLRARGVKMVTISVCTGWSLPTVERHTKKGAV